MRSSPSLLCLLTTLPTVLLVSIGATALHSERVQSSIRFVDSTSEVGIGVHISHGGVEKEWIAEANGSGAAVLDYDDDGWMDVLVLSGSTMEELRRVVAGETPSAAAGRVYLYRNIEGRRFEDVTARSDLDSLYWGTGSNAADYDNDGDVDILITAIGVDLLYRNEGDGTFVEVGAEARLSQVPAWHTGSSFGDIDSDGDLDLYVASYLSLESLPIEGKAPVCDYRSLGVFCGPLNLEAGEDVLYRNNGDGSFTEITERAGIGSKPSGYGFTPVIEDFNQNGHLDIFVANDSSPNSLYVNSGRGAFSEDALTAGLAYNADGKKQSDMGACVGDYDNDGDLDILTTTFSEDYFPLFQQREPGVYEDVAFAAALQRETTPQLGWACGFSDLDNDGDRDLWVANGHVYPTAGRLGSTSYRQPIRILENQAGRFVASPEATAAIADSSYRGAASADFNNDGRVDLLVLPIDGSPVLLRNYTENRHSWLGVSLRPNHANREGIGARVEIEHCGERQFDTLRNGGGYASRSDPRMHFGLGACDQVDALTVYWPAGEKRTFRNLDANQWLELAETR